VNIQQYIETGIIESYALGLASSEEAAEFEKLLSFYPEVQLALAEFEYQLELFAVQSEIPPPPGIRGKIEKQLRDLPVIKRSYRKERSNGSNGNQQHEYIPVQSSSTHIWVHKSWRTWFIVFCIMSKIFLALFIYYFVQYQHAQKDILQLQSQLNRTAPAARVTIVPAVLPAETPQQGQ
jgi:hypothetical protein